MGLFLSVPQKIAERAMSSVLYHYPTLSKLMIISGRVNRSSTPYFVQIERCLFAYIERVCGSLLRWSTQEIRPDDLLLFRGFPGFAREQNRHGHHGKGRASDILIAKWNELVLSGGAHAQYELPELSIM